MTESSARVFSASKQAPLQLHQGQVCLGAQDIHVWLSDRDEFSGSSAFLRRILSQYADVCEADWEFVRGEHGKPMLVGAPKNLDFNLSHSGERLACAITAGSPVGVDLEQCKQGRDVMRVARRFFCADEVAALESCDIATQRDRFYDLWTLKEAAIKCRGAALASGLDAHGFALVFNSHPVTLGGRITVTSPDEADAAHYCLLEPYPAYRMAICSSSGIDLRSQTQLFQLCQDGTITSLEVPLRASTWCV